MSHTYIKRILKASHLLPLAILAAVVSFQVGTRTAGNVQTVGTTSATDGSTVGDVNQDGTVDEADVIVILEVAQGYRPATPHELTADPNGNGILTVDDAIRVLRSLTSR